MQYVSDLMLLLYSMQPQDYVITNSNLCTIECPWCENKKMNCRDVLFFFSSENWQIFVKLLKLLNCLRGEVLVFCSSLSWPFP